MPIVPPVLMYHQVDALAPADPVGRALTVRPAQFDRELTFLAKHRLRAVSVRDYVRAVRAHTSTANMVIVTFDDGYADQYTRAFRILRAHRAHATFFITTGNVGKPNHLTWRDIGIMARAGMSFGGHNVDHIDLALLDRAQQRMQIDGCLNALRAHLGVQPVAYAYPSGAFNRATEALLAEHSIVLAFTTDPRFEIGRKRRFEIPRIRVERDMPLATFAAVVTSPVYRFSLAALPKQQPQQLRARAVPQSR